MNHQYIIDMLGEVGIVTGPNLLAIDGQRYRSLGAATNVKESHLLEFTALVIAKDRERLAAGVEFPDPFRKQGQQMAYDGYDKVFFDCFTADQLRDYGDRRAAAEREACAGVAKAISDKYAYGYYGQEVDTADEIEAAIRARGQQC